jgi:hypothetical protein
MWPFGEVGIVASFLARKCASCLVWKKSAKRFYRSHSPATVEHSMALFYSIDKRLQENPAITVLKPDAFYAESTFRTFATNYK